nr:serine/arginine repetitive matrix protein 1-like [Globicephala melas]
MPLRGRRTSGEGQSGGSSARVPQAMRPEPPLGKGHRPWTPPRPPPGSMTDTPNRRGQKPADNGRGSGATAAGARVATSKIRHRSSGQRQGQGSSPPRSRAGPPHPPRRPTRHPRTAPPMRRTRPPRRPGPPRAARPPGPLTRPRSSRSRRRRRRTLRPRPSHGRRLTQEPHHSSRSWAAGPGTTSFRNRLAPPPS